MSKVLIVADTHFPFVHPKYFQFVKDTQKKYKTTKTVFIGDITDQHALSFHEHDPDGMSAGNEIKAAQEHVAKWHKAFPKAKVCIGNHDARTVRIARKAGLPMEALKDFATLWKTPGWDWKWDHIIDDVLYTHGTGASGKDAAYNLAMKRRKSVVIGHTHTNAGVKYHSNVDNVIFGLNVGCGIDCKAYAFAYAKDFTDRPMLGCGVVDNGDGLFIRMRCGKGEKYAR